MSDEEMERPGLTPPKNSTETIGNFDAKTTIFCAPSRPPRRVLRDELNAGRFEGGDDLLEAAGTSRCGAGSAQCERLLPLHR
jgi:hypothetical protein